MSVFDPSFDNLPDTLPIFPLTGAIVLPGTTLPLNIFEPRYLAMTTVSLGGNRMIGMVQPKDPESNSDKPETYTIGCAGRIIQFEETEDGRFMINLKGVSRFRITQELSGQSGFRQVQPDWQPFHADLGQEGEAVADTTRLLSSLKPFFDEQGIEANWDAIKSTPADRLVNSLAMVCPFEPLEKQALLEAVTLEERLTVLTQLVEMAVLETSHEESGKQ